MIGSNVKNFCCDDVSLIGNYDKAVNDDKSPSWHCHHRLETHNSDGEKRLVDISVDELKALDMYYHRPASELIFLPAAEHISLHTKLSEGRTNEKVSKGKTGKHPSEESCKKMSESATKRWALWRIKENEKIGK